MKKAPEGKKRCAIYTRKSTEEGLEQEFNSLDAQRESAEAYIKSQLHQGWQCVPTRYDDGGYTGGNMERPALKRLMADIEAGLVDCVVVYKVDRLSRSLLDFARLLEVFDRHKVAFVSVTQSFNTADSSGRLMLHILLSFAQYEREMISERTRDKMGAARRKGKYVGGTPILGYDVDRASKKLIVDEDEAAQVRAIFQLYLDLGALLPVVQELARRGWTLKRWQMQNGLERGGKPFTKTSLHKLLTNVTYVGKAKYKKEIYDGEQPAIVPLPLWNKVHALLEQNGRAGGTQARNKYGALLKGMLYCSACNCAMTPTVTARRKGRQYRYYVCQGAQKHGWHTCPSKSLPAAEIERVVIDQIRAVGQDPALVRATFAATRKQTQERLVELDAETRRLERERGRKDADVPAIDDRLADIYAERLKLEGLVVTENEVATVLGDFECLWGALSPREQARVIDLLIAQVEYHGGTGKVGITFQPAGIRALVEQFATEEAA